MTPEEIINGNILIAEFLNWDTCEYIQRITNSKHPLYKIKKEPITVFCLPIDHPIVNDIYTDRPGFSWNYDKEDENGNTIIRLIFFNEDLIFHSSWNWLIPVIDKITSTNDYFDFKDKTTSIVDEGGIFINYRFIENTFEQVIEFIKYYNSIQ